MGCPDDYDHAKALAQLLYEAREALRRARRHGYRTDCLNAAVNAIEGALANAEGEANGG